MNGRPSIASGTVFHVNATIEIKNFHFLSKDQQNVDNNYENGPNLKVRLNPNWFKICQVLCFHSLKFNSYIVLLA